MIPVSAFLFDLDGTLVDSLADILEAFNVVLTSYGRPTLTRESLRPRLGRGAAPVLGPLLDSPDPDATIVREAVQRFLDYYRHHLVRHTLPREGVVEMLDFFGDVPKFVVSNKAEVLVRGVLEELGLAGYFHAIYGGDSFGTKKPDPLPLLEAVKPLYKGPADMVMVGDSPIDVEAGRRAGMRTCAVLHGFCAEEDVRKSCPDVILSGMHELISTYQRLE